MFIESTALAWVTELEQGWAAVQAECLELEPNSFAPWVQREMHGGGWSVYGLIAFGERIEPALARCPATAACLQKIPGLTTAGFSRLAGGARIQPHRGWVTTVYRGHLGLVVPPDCALRVGTQTRTWSAGQCLIFDDTAEHEAWNRSDADRFVLLFDFFRPGLQAPEQDIPPAEVRAFVQQHQP